jgi:catalase
LAVSAPHRLKCPVITNYARIAIAGNQNSITAGELGSADTARDPLKLSGFIHSQKRDPRTGMRDNTLQRDF